MNYDTDGKKKITHYSQGANKFEDYFQARLDSFIFI